MTTKTMYVYTDGNGTEAHYVERIDSPYGKQFRQYHQAVGGKLPNLPVGTTLYPYHLPELLNAKTVYIVEGEKCCDHLRRFLILKGITDFAVTTFCGGSNGWRGHYAEHFKDKTVFLFPDHDKSGYKFVSQVAAGIGPVVHALKLVTMPIPEGSEASGYDIADFLKDEDPSFSVKKAVKWLTELSDSSVDTCSDHIQAMADQFFGGSPILPSNDAIPPLQIAQ
jgi:hypothetical protein